MTAVAPLKRRGALSERPVLFFAIAAVAFACSAGAAAQVRSPFPWLPTNFDTTVAGNYRGAKLTSRAQLDSLRQRYGIRMIINLAKDALPKSGGSEIEWTRDLGIGYLPVYLGTKPPSDAQWKRIREELDKGGVYVHCAHGADRTGAIIARYRTEVERMSPDSAYREARRFGFKPWLKELKEWGVGLLPTSTSPPAPFPGLRARSPALRP
ncbi:MAG: dual specificity protein phosphatase family protein [Ignavibacteria bacterium]|nr:dual specificity protein phosphatase family protein [Ignavibacteria bacterium]